MNVYLSRMLPLLFVAVVAPVFAQPLAVVNGKPIPASAVDLMVQDLSAQGQKDSVELRAKIKDELINREVLMQEAGKLGLDKTAEVKRQIEVARESIIILALYEDFEKKHPITDSDIQAEYDRIKSLADDKEYHARYILVDKEEDAKAIIVKLKEGGKFEELAKQSKDTNTGARGGDLDWVNPAAVVKPFAAALHALKKGEYTQTPVKTDAGFNVIKLEDIRPTTLPPLQQVKEQIVKKLKQSRLQAYQQDLRKQATIK